MSDDEPFKAQFMGSADMQLHLYRSVPNAGPFDQPAFIAAIAMGMGSKRSGAVNSSQHAVKPPTVTMGQLAFFSFKASSQ